MASWADSLKKPFREIKAKYTKSELTLIAWDSRLKSYNLSLGMANTKTTPKISNGIESSETVSPAGVKETEGAYVLPKGVNNGVPINKKFFDENGDIDLRRGTGPEVANYIRRLGIPLAIVPGRSKK